MIELLFWLSIIFILYTYIGYSLIITILAIYKQTKRIKQEIYPSVTVLISAYNEEKDIQNKIEWTLDQEYPPEKIEILVASDGSTDNTEKIVSSIQDKRVRLLRVEGRKGKTEAQNVAVKQAKGEIIIFSDATTRYEKNAISRLVRNYADPTIGAVSGRYEYYNPTGASIGIGNILFWKYENFIKKSQTNIRTITGCCGCIYSVRRELYEPLPADIISDLVEPLKILEKGYRIVFEPDAIAYEETTEKIKQEFSMRVRVIIRGMRGLLYMRKLLNPFKYGFISFQLISHKINRWLVPLALVILFITNSMLLENIIYLVLFVLQVVFYFLAILGFYTEKLKIQSSLLNIPLYFIVVNLASLVAMIKLALGEKAITWETLRH